MLIDQRALIPDPSRPVARLREECVGCDDCNGVCLEFIQVHLMPEILNRQAGSSQ